MYEVFDRFLEHDTWFKMHDGDIQLFFRYLDKIIDQKEFNPSEMADYFQDSLGDDAEPFMHAIKRYHGYADAIKEYKRYQKQI